MGLSNEPLPAPFSPMANTGFPPRSNASTLLRSASATITAPPVALAATSIARLVNSPAGLGAESEAARSPAAPSTTTRLLPVSATTSDAPAPVARPTAAPGAAPSGMPNPPTLHRWAPAGENQWTPPPAPSVTATAAPPPAPGGPQPPGGDSTAAMPCGRDSPSSAASKARSAEPDALNAWTRALPASATYTRPPGPAATPAGPSSAVPPLPPASVRTCA